MTTKQAEPQRGAPASADPSLAYEIHARACHETDFWGQVRRTVGGRPAPSDQIDLIVDEVMRLGDFRDGDVLLDICCGNGALGAPWFRRCGGGLGVDISETLIGVARRHFDFGDAVEYRVADAVEFALTEPNAGRFTKAVVYGSICYFAPERAETMFRALRERFSGIERLVVGNIADRDRLDDFFAPGAKTDGAEDDPGSAIGVWWTRDAFAEMAARAGWTARISRMREPFYARHYRFDALLTPAS